MNELLAKWFIADMEREERLKNKKRHKKPLKKMLL